MKEVKEMKEEMRKYPEVLRACPLFAGIDESELQALLDCLSASKRHFAKGSFVFMTGENVTAVGVVLSGSVHVLQEDFWGNRTILAHVGPGGLFAEAFSCAEVDKLPVSVIAAEPSDILFIDYKRIATTCSSACTFHTGLIKNMMHILAQKNVQLTQKIEHVTGRTTRAKLLAYLSAQARKAADNIFEIPFSRQELADYLSVDRSAMSNELCKMRDEGILRFHKNRFELLEPEN
jgi:CRP-like cAMP-binding protein